MKWIFLFLPLTLSHSTKADYEVTMSAYSAACATDSNGGPDQSKWGGSKLRPSQFTLDQSSKYVMIAVSNSGGTNSLRQQCFTARGGEGDGKISNSHLGNIHSKIFVAADQCRDCNNKQQVDVATSCGSNLDSNLTVTKVKLEEIDCPPDIQEAMNSGALPKSNGVRNPASVSPSGTSR